MFRFYYSNRSISKGSIEKGKIGQQVNKQANEQANKQTNGQTNRNRSCVVVIASHNDVISPTKAISSTLCQYTAIVYCRLLYCNAIVC